MTTLTQLIEHYCPDSVECVKLGDVAIRQRGIAITAAKMRELDSPNGGIVVFGAGATRALIDSSEIASTNIHTKDSVIVKARGHVGFEMCTVPFTTKSELWSYRSDDPKLNIRYGYYFLSEHSGELAEIARLNGVKLPQLKVSDTDNYLIPLPPREVQDAIVERLDAFATLVESLDSEIVLLEKRFEYFREQLLTFDDSAGVEYVNLGDVATVKAGSSVSKQKIAESAGIYPVINSGREPLGFIAEFNSTDPIGITTRGAGVGFVSWTEGPHFKGNLNYSVKVNSHIVSDRFLFFTLKEHGESIRDLCSFAGIPALNLKSIKTLVFPLPPREVQDAIVDKLDTLQALIDNLKHERDLRRTQFAYYREKLLTFNS